MNVKEKIKKSGLMLTKVLTYRYNETHKLLKWQKI